MTHSSETQSRFSMTFDPKAYRRIISGKEVIIHCHHYNSRIQNTIEGSSEVDGKGIIRSAAEVVFSEQIHAALRSGDSLEVQWQVASGLYSHLGYGTLDFSQLSKDLVTATASHYVEGWNAGFPERSSPACTVAEGYIQAAIYALTDELVDVKETVCMVAGAPACQFAIGRGRREPLARAEKRRLDFASKSSEGFVRSTNVDEKKIIEALVGMPIHGNDAGLIPAFGVYLANTPADFYNLINIRFVEEMTKKGMASAARRLLAYDAETCGMNTFRGIMSSAEWDGLVAPMIKEPRDALFGLIGVSNGLGWGNWHVKSYEPGQSVELESLNGYEALGFREFRGSATDPQCFMLTGVAAGIMELIHGEGSIQERFGTFLPTETKCICCENESCSFEVEKA